MLGHDLRRTGNGYNAKTDTFHLPLEEWDALIKINENVSTFRKAELSHEDLMEAIFVNRVVIGKYATGPARDDFINTTTLDVSVDFDIEDENNVSTDLAEGDTNTYFTDRHFEPSRGSFPTWSQAKHFIPQQEQSTPYHFM
ncbi:hypothetical protein GIB67_001285 [Kingdonia uniflora]|uniref:Uncharacterized protein n=1 Tax=Kingdonia uniflora TaxID=39325 RepID=A0A7J7LKZ9_9MAGN|nr:hypothetical protein GIB67_001285 [Kingdonia uniflora]